MIVQALRLAAPYRAHAMALLVSLVLAACAHVLGPRTVLIPQATLQNRLNALPPVQRQALGLFSVRLDHPVLMLQGEKNRIAVQWDFTVHSVALRHDTTGQIHTSFAVLYRAEDRCLTWHEPSIDAIVVDGLSSDSLSALSKLASLALSERLEGSTLYQISEQKLSVAEHLGWHIGSVNVTEQGLAVELLPQ